MLLSAYVDISRPFKNLEERLVTVPLPPSSLRLFAALRPLVPLPAIFVSAWVVANFDSVFVTLRCDMICRDNAHQFPARMCESWLLVCKCLVVKAHVVVHEAAAKDFVGLAKLRLRGDHNVSEQQQRGQQH